MRTPRRHGIPPSALALALLVLAGASAPAARGGDPVKSTASDVSIPLPRGGSLEGTLHRPETFNGTAVVIASGQGAHRKGRLFVACADALAGAGFLALRFDWAYFTAKGQPSAKLAQEVEDLEAALAFVRAQEGVKNVILAGKSLGSLVALKRAAKKADDLAALALLTFPIHDPGGRPTEDVVDVNRLTLPTFVLCGDRDPLCNLGLLYHLLADAKTPPVVAIVPGDHGLQGPTKSDSETAENHDLAARSLVLWARRRVGS